jgi:fibronectin-binding autotransporter adhesin
MPTLMGDHVIATLGKLARALGSVLVLSGLVLGFPSSARAQVWNGSVSDLWGTAANWTPTGVPAAGASVTINTATNNPVVINVNPTIDNLTLGASSSLSLSDNQSLTIVGGGGNGVVDNAGQFSLSSAGDNTDLRINGSVTLTGGGTLTLSNFVQNRIFSDTGSSSDTLTNVNNTIQGAGQIGVNGLTLVNQAAGTIDANVSSSLTINASSTTNTGLIEATGAGTLNLNSAVTNTGGTILSSGAGSVVNLSGGSITGGTLSTASGGVMNVGNGTLNGVTISTGSTATAGDNTVTTIQGTVTNNGTIAIQSVGDNTDLAISGTLSNTGGGSITMSNFTGNRIYGSGGTLTNDTGSTIQGAGQIGVGESLTLNNKGTIDANVSASLTINSTVAATNSGTLEATAGGTLNLGGNFTNTGTIQAAGGSLVNLAGAASTTITNTGGLVQATGSGSLLNLGGGGTGTIIGGTLSSSGGGSIENTGSGALNGVSVSNGSTFTALDNTYTALMGTTTFHDTAISLKSAGDNTDLQLSGGATVELTSGSSLRLRYTDQ